MADGLVGRVKENEERAKEWEQRRVKEQLQAESDDMEGRRQEEQRKGSEQLQKESDEEEWRRHEEQSRYRQQLVEESDEQEGRRQWEDRWIDSRWAGSSRMHPSEPASSKESIDSGSRKDESERESRRADDDAKGKEREKVRFG